MWLVAVDIVVIRSVTYADSPARVQYSLWISSAGDYGNRRDAVSALPVIRKI